VVYLYPILVYFIFGTGFDEINIYGLQSEGFFYSNHYGWASTMFLCTVPAIFQIFRLPSLYRIFLMGCTPLAIYLLIISANRASLLSISICLLALIFYRKGFSLLSKKNAKIAFVLVLGLIYFAIGLKDRKGSAIDFVLKKNEMQFETREKSENRFEVSSFAVNRFNETPILWITGNGLFNHEYIRGVTNLASFHNSYMEILFGGGVLIFFMFLIMMLFRPLYLYFVHLGNFGIIIIPLILIPFFESNLTGGQFLFFPWFIIMILFNCKDNEIYKSASDWKNPVSPVKVTNTQIPQILISKSL
jgi:hypothetical protein